MNLSAWLFSTFLAAAIPAATAATTPDNLAARAKVDDRGILAIDGLSFYLHHFDQEWRGSSPQHELLLNRKQQGNSAADYRLEADLTTRKNLTMKIDERIIAAAPDRLEYRTVITAPQAVNTRLLSLNASLPLERFCGMQLHLDGNRTITLPKEFNPTKSPMLFNGNVTQVLIPGPDGNLVLSGKLHLQVQDDRKWNHQEYTIRLLFNPDHGALTRSELAIDFGYRPYRATPINLRSVVNMGFADRTANDGKGGWTDQGERNDLHMLQPGPCRLKGIDFDLIDPAANSGKSCLVLSGPDREYFPAAAEVKSNLPPHRWLYLLHALAWPPAGAESIGRIVVTYGDNSTAIIPVTANIDVGNWWEPVPRPNGLVVWTGENRSSYVGLYRAAFPLKPLPIKNIRFESAKNAVWGIVAASVSDELAPGLITMPAYITAGREWHPVSDRKDIVPGSILDFSSHLDAPAGKYGRTIIRNGKLVFADRPDVPVRFYGTNLVSSAPLLSKAWAERLADRLAAFGYNAVRLHHHDNNLVLHQNGSSTELNPKTIDQIDYLIYCLKKRGIYLSTDLYVSRRLVKGELKEFPDREIGMDSFKGLAFINEAAMKNWETFSRNWLNHVNPYTGMALKDDPVLISLSLINEDNIGNSWKCEPWLAEYYQQKFAVWLKKHGLNPASARERQELMTRFLVETYSAAYARMVAFVRDLGVKTVLTDQNMQDQPILALMRKEYDYVDSHGYWDHPRFPINSWKLPSSLQNVSALARAAEVPAKNFPSRLFGKPMMITEFDFARPNFFRAEGPVLYGAYAALQDWDALFHFAYSHRSERLMRPDQTEGHFDAATDIVKLLSQRLGVALFLWRQVDPAGFAIAVPVDTIEGKDFAQRYPDAIFKLGLIAQVGTITGGGPIPAGLKGLITIEKKIPAGLQKYPAFPAMTPNAEVLQPMLATGILKPQWYDPKAGIFRAATGQLELNQTAETFSAVTPGCEVFILPEKRQATGHFIRIDNREGRAVFGAVAIDRLPLSQSRRILLLHLTDSQPTKLKFGNRQMTLMETWGEGPLLVRKGVAEITLSATGSSYRLFAVDTAGQRLYQVPGKKDSDGKPQFKLDVFAGKEPAMAYELLRD